MSEKMFIHFDREGDFLEVRFGKPVPSYYEDLGGDIFERRDEQSNKVIGYAFFNVSKRKEKQVQDIEIDLPVAVSS